MSNYGICSLTLIPMRKEPAERSEMVSQVLFGETFEIIERHGSWFRLRTDFDQYEGWVGSSMVTRMASDAYLLQKDKTKIYLKDPVCKVSGGWFVAVSLPGRRKHTY